MKGDEQSFCDAAAAAAAAAARSRRMFSTRNDVLVVEGLNSGDNDAVV